VVLTRARGLFPDGETRKTFTEEDGKMDTKDKLEGMTAIWLLTVTTFEEDDDGEYISDVIFTCAYGRRSKAMEAKEKVRAMFPRNIDIEYRVERVLFVQDELPSVEEEMAYNLMGETAKDWFENYWGPRCKGYEEGCPTCDAYAERDAREGAKK